MPRRLRRSAALAVPLVALAGLVAGCGSETPGNGLEFGDRLEAVTIGGEPGQTPTVEFEERMAAGELEVDTPTAGDGAALAEGDQAYVDVVLADGFTRQTAVDTYGKELPAIAVTVGGDPNPQPLTLNDVIGNFLLDHLTTEVTRGSRLVMTGDTQAFFGDLSESAALAQAGIGNDDGLLLVADVSEARVLTHPTGPTSAAPAWAPRVVLDGGRPSGLDFTGVPKPDDKLESAAIRRGSGAKVAKNDLIVVNYLGQLADQKLPFDESYSEGKEPIATGIGIGSVVAGWDKELVGQTVGSRVLLKIPPADGYGDEGSGSAIPGGSTLYFVVDILAAL